MSNQNHVFLGNLTRDPELRYTPSGDAVANFSVAVNGRTPEDTVYFECETWGKNAETLTKYFKKGKPILVIDCIVRPDSWTDKTTGEKRTKHKYKVNRFGFPPTNKGDVPDTEAEEEEETQPTTPPPPVNSKRQAPPPPKRQTKQQADPDDQDIPF